MDLKKIAVKWQQKWEKDKIFQVKKSSKKKQYILEMYPYPSGSGLHMGHAFNYTIGDIYARFKIMNGFNVLHPMGYDSFGLPAENAAIQAGIHPKKYTDDAITQFTKQQKALGLTYDWSRMLKSHDPHYYQWNQYFFIKFWEKGLVYRKEAPVNWCPKCNTVLANEQVHNGICWRHKETQVIQKQLEQWFIKTTQYADALLNDISTLDWPEKIKIMQKNWIGKSHGAEITFKINEQPWKIFTTRPDTLFGVTFMVIAAQHPQLMELVTEENKEKIKEFVARTKKVDPTQDKEGVFTGSYAEHPFTKEKIPVWAGNFVLAEYGSGMVMAVPAHDQRDYDFAQKYEIPIKQVIQSKEESKAYVGKGKLINSEEFNDTSNEEAKKAIIKKLEQKNKGKPTIQYKLRDWLISRQRYWGTPIPMMYCDDCGVQPDRNLPVRLPDDVTFGKGNPLTTSKTFVDVNCPECGKKAKRETDTMDTFFDSSWYFLRFTDNLNKVRPFDKDKVNYWMPVDQYIGGAEHACMHLIYARFFTKALRDIDMLAFDEPFTSLFNQGLIHGNDGFVMSKSRGNVIDPLVIINQYGPDALRFFLVSIASPDKDFNWDDKGVHGAFKLLTRITEYANNVKLGKTSERVAHKLNKAVKHISKDIEEFKYMSAIIHIRKLFEHFEEEISKEDIMTFIKILTPFCPHLTEELWSKQGETSYISLAPWPHVDESKINPELEIADDYVDTVMADVRSVLELAHIDKPKEIILFTAPLWKYQLYAQVKPLLETTRDTQTILRSIMQTELKQQGKKIPKLVAYLLKKIPSTIITQEQEKNYVQEAKKVLEQEFGVIVQIINAENTQEPKAHKALPSKPALLVK